MCSSAIAMLGRPKDKQARSLQLLQLDVSRETCFYFLFVQFNFDINGVTFAKTKVPNFVDLNKVFEVPPYSQSVTLGKQVEIRCHPPKGKPRPRVIKHLARQLSPI